MAGLPPMAACPYCKQPYPRVQLAQHKQQCADNPANKR